MLQNFAGEYLRGRSFKGQDLTGANFSRADIRSADFTAAQNMSISEQMEAIADPAKRELAVNANVRLFAIMHAVGGAMPTPGFATVSHLMTLTELFSNAKSEGKRTFQDLQKAITEKHKELAPAIAALQEKFQSGKISENEYIKEIKAIA